MYLEKTVVPIGSNAASQSVESGTVGPLLPGDLPGYEVRGVLGQGGTGVVFQARQINLNRIVAIKHISSQRRHSAHSVKSILIEAQNLAKLNHPNIVQIYGVEQVDGQFFLVMEFVEGGNLARHCTGTALAASQAALLVESAARAVQVAHDQGIVHRDLKPTNILLTREGSPKIADFGLAKLINQSAGSESLNGPCGTPSYMAPEQYAAAHETIGPATDVYALGAVLYELLTGRPVFRGNSLHETARLVTTTDAVPPGRLRRDLPRDLEAICLKCLAKSPSKRYSSALQLAEDLCRFQKGEPVNARRLLWPTRVWRYLRRHPRQLRLASFCLVLGIIVAELEFFQPGMILLHNRPSPPVIASVPEMPTVVYDATVMLIDDRAEVRHATLELELIGRKFWSGVFVISGRSLRRDSTGAYAFSVLTRNLGDIASVRLRLPARQNQCQSMPATVQLFDTEQRLVGRFEGAAWRADPVHPGYCECELQATSSTATTPP